MRLIRTLGLVVILALSAFTALAQEDVSTLNLNMDNAELGSYLVDADGMALYIFTNDVDGTSTCSGDCLEAWPALIVAEGETVTTGSNISGRTGTVAREDGTIQVTYNGMPLYYFASDEAAGDTNGQGLGDVWFVAQTPTVGIGGNEDLGRFLVDANGITLYTFDNDSENESACSGDCAAAWPPLTVESADDLTWQAGVAGEWASFEREDGTLQVSFNGQPLYYWQDDAVAGDASGHTLGDVWFVARANTVNVREDDTLGTIFAGPDGMTLYTFDNDADGASNCNDDCAVAWPPLTVVADEALVAAEGIALDTIERADGTLQVTINGEPVYYWQNDLLPDDTTGHTLGDVWFVAQ